MRQAISEPLTQPILGALTGLLTHQLIRRSQALLANRRAWISVRHFVY